MGGLIDLLLKQNLTPVALTPDWYQIDYVKKKYPEPEILHTKFEQLHLEKFRNYFLN